MFEKRPNHKDSWYDKNFKTVPEWSKMVVNYVYWQQYVKGQLRPWPTEPLHRLSRKSVETGTNSSDQKLISRNSRKSLPQKFRALLGITEQTGLSNAWYWHDYFR